jgi:hypothetical protein
MKNALLIAVIASVLGFCIGYALSEVALTKQEMHLYELVKSWNEFENEYREDIARIDDLRCDMNSLKLERDMWEKIAFEFKEEAESFRMERNMYHAESMR